MSEFITIPVKKGFTVDICTPIIKYIEDAKCYGSSSDYIPSLNKLHSLRQDCIGQLGEKNDKALKSVHKYADQIMALEVKLPFSENQLRINFKWQDALFGSKLRARNDPTLTMASGAYEKICVLFNCAALETLIADQQNYDLDDGLKMAVKLFQQASGIMIYIQTILPTLFSNCDPTNDLQMTVLNCLSMITLAQAQDVYVKKAVKDKMKSSLLSKLSQQASSLYEETLKAIQTEPAKTILPKEWFSIINMKKTAFESLANYFDGMAYTENKKFGEAIARFKYSKTLMAKAHSQNYLKPFPYEALQKQIDIEMNKTEKENAFIYCSAVTDINKLPVIEKAVIAKPTMVGDVKFSADSEDLLARLVPAVVLQAASSCEERRIEIVQKEIARLKGGSHQLNSAMVAQNLPAALEDVTGDRVPHSIFKKSAEMRNLGGYQHLERLVSDLPTMLNKCKIIIDECEKHLSDEEQLDRIMKAKYQYNWTRTSSFLLNAPIKEELRKYRSVINEALIADNMVHTKFNQYKSAIALLSDSDADIEKSLPQGNVSIGPISNKVCVIELNKLMDQVLVLKGEREKIENKLKDTKIDITTKFLSQYIKSGVLYEQSLSMAELDKVYGPMREQVSRNLSQQDKIIKQIEAANFEFLKLKSQVGLVSMGAREAKLKELATAYDSFMEIFNIAKEGNTFYGDFTLHLDKLKIRIRDFCNERNLEKENLILTLGTESPLSYQPNTPTFVGFHQGPQPAFSTQTMYQALPSSTLIIGGTQPQLISSAYYRPTMATIGYNPYSTYFINR